MKDINSESYLEMFDFHSSDSVVGSHLFRLQNDFDVSVRLRLFDGLWPVLIAFALGKFFVNESLMLKQLTYSSPLQEVGDHDNHIDVLLPNHSPYRATRVSVVSTEQKAKSMLTLCHYLAVFVAFCDLGPGMV